jgi:hypothetical protein
MSQDDDSPEIEVSGDVPTPRRRTPNPMVDEQIHQGEIEAPRSMIVRSTPSMEMPKIEIAEEKLAPAPTAAPPRQYPRARTAGVRRSSILPIVLGLALAAGGVIGALLLVGKSKSTTSSGSTSQTDQHRLALQAAAQFIGTSLDADAKAALVRAEAMASSSMLRAGILTDAQTLQDMAKDKDVVFRLGPGDAVEVVQVRDGNRLPLLRIPSDGTLDAPAVGKTKLALRDGAPIMIANAEIAAQQGVSGEVVLASPIDLEPMKKRVAGHAVEATITGLGAPIVLAKTNAPGGEKVKLLIETEAKLPIALEVVFAK